MVTERLRRIPSQSGQSTVEVDGIAYHSVYNPLREVRKFYSGLQLEQADVLLHFGWGLGYCGEILRERAKWGSRIVVFEPDEELFKLFLSESGSRTFLEDPRFQFVVGPAACQLFDEWRLGDRQETDQCLWIEWPAAVRTNGMIAESLKRQFKTHLRDRAANLLTHFQRGETYFSNAIANFDYQCDADAGGLFGRFHDLPVVIVSAGPSLDHNVGELRGFEDRCVILSVDTALRPLLAAGITPHAVIIADASEVNARHVVGAMPVSTYLIAEQAVHPTALQAATRRFLFGLGMFPDPLFAKFGFGKSRIDAWGSVATTALDLACRMGASPIIFAGQDFAYSWNREYASNTIFHGSYSDVSVCGTARSHDIRGEEVYTTENLIAYRDYFIRRMKQSPDIRFINATEGGILTQGAEILTLKEALRQSCVRKVDASGMLRECHRPSKTSTEALHHLRQVLQYRRTDCACLGGFLELTAKKHVLKKNELEIQKAILWGAQCISDRCTGLSRHNPGA
jgi:hypothetical protein